MAFLRSWMSLACLVFRSSRVESSSDLKALNTLVSTFWSNLPTAVLSAAISPDVSSLKEYRASLREDREFPKSMIDSLISLMSSPSFVSRFEREVLTPAIASSTDCLNSANVSGLTVPERLSTLDWSWPRVVLISVLNPSNAALVSISWMDAVRFPTASSIAVWTAAWSFPYCSRNCLYVKVSSFVARAWLIVLVSSAIWVLY